MNFKKLLTSSIIGAAALTISAIPALAAPIVSNGSFEDGNDPGAYTTVNSGQTNINNWSIDSGDIDYIGSLWQASDLTRSIDLNGFGPGKISQSIPTIVGHSYKVTFDLSGNPHTIIAGYPQYDSPAIKKLTVSATGSQEQTFNYDISAKGNSFSDMKYDSETYTFVATNPNTTLTFTSITAGAFGPALDNVVVEDTSLIAQYPQCVQDVKYNVIEGTSGDDVLNGTIGPDLILAYGGDDKVNGNGGNDCIVGDGGKDILNGGNGNDVIIGGNGDDTIDGGNGKDTIYAGAGEDKIQGGNDDDQISGGADDDNISGENGKDIINADGGNDKVSGGNGIDFIYGGQGDDIINGDNDNDTINGDAGDDKINGGNGNDTINGGPGIDKLLGENGKDTLIGDDGSDTANGGNDKDTCDAETEVSCEL